MRVFITGVSSGVGRALARHLVANGHEVWGVARRAALLQALADDLASPAFTWDACDIGDPVANAALRNKMRERGYLPDAVVLNAALEKPDPPPGLDAAQSAAIMRCNYDGAHFWVAAFLEDFLQRGAGQFVGVASIFARWPYLKSPSYSASKAALAMLFRGLRLRHAGSGVSFKLLYLGPVDTPINPGFDPEAPADSQIVASAADTAAFIATLLASRRENFYFPFYIRVVFALLGWLPDRLFERLTGPFRR